MTPAWTVGIDLSSTGLGLAAIPGVWDPARRCEWRRIRRTTLTTKPGLPFVARADMLANDVVRWLLRLECPADELVICHEGYPLGAGGLYNVDKLCEVGGIVKRAIWLEERLNLELWSAAESTARKLVCGKCPQRDRKRVTAAVLRQLAQGELDDATLDECDAITATNLHRSELGLSFVALPAPVEERRHGKGRAA